MVPSPSGPASASLMRRCWSSRESPLKLAARTVTWKWSPPPVRSSTCSSAASGNARSKRVWSFSTATRPWYRRAYDLRMVGDGSVTELGLFPLEAVLLPRERIPLHIFELRYQELIGECVELESDFGLVFEDDEGTRDIGTRARVIEILER